MDASGEDDFQRVKTAVDSWAAEVSQVRSTLAEKLFVQMDTTRPAFRLHRARTVTPPATDSPAPHDTILDLHARVRQTEEENQRLVPEIDFVREQLHVQNRRANDAAALAAENTERVEEMARALGRMRIELDDMIEQLRSKDWVLLQIKNENELLRGDDGARISSRVVPVDDYDALVISHMGLREEVTALQQRIVQRDHELMGVREQLADVQAELAAWESVGPVSGAGIAKLAGLLAVRSAALEEFEDTTLGQKYLIGALRLELNAVRATLDRRELDHERLAQALRAELESLRGLSTERDFVIGHQSETLETGTQREQGMVAELAEARETVAFLRRRADQAVDERESLARDLHLLRAKSADREAELWRLRASPAPSATGDVPGLAQLEAALASRDAELVRARERIAFLRSGSDAPKGAATTDTAPVGGPPPAVAAEVGVAPAVDPSSLSLDGIQMNSALQREVEQALDVHFPWPLVAVLGGIAGMGLLVLGLLVLVLL